MEDFFIPEFTLDHFDFDFDLSIYEEDLLSEIPQIEVTQKPHTNPHDHHHQQQQQHHHADDDDQSRLGFLCERPVKKMKINSLNSSPSSQLISFEFSNVSCRNTSEDISIEHYGSSPILGKGATREACGSNVRSSVLAKEHVLAERKRREKLSERFIALSALLPGLKKSDKATVLGNAISHLKELQERVRELEDEKEASRETESTIFVKKSKIFIDEDDATPRNSSLTLPEIEAKASREDVLIRIHCERSKGCMITILNEIEKLHLSVVNSIALPFGDSTLDITVLAKMEEDFSMTVNDLVQNLRLAII